MSDFVKSIILAIIGSGVISSIISTILAGIQSKNTLYGGLKHVLYFQIKQGCKDAIKEGSIDDDSLQALHEAWEIYHNKLGGNGYLNTLMTKVNTLPIDSTEKK